MRSTNRSAIKHLDGERGSTTRELGPAEIGKAPITREPAKGAIVVMGIGGAGSNIIKRISSLHIKGVECIAINTHKQYLDSIPAHKKILIGEKSTHGFGTERDLELGATAAEESRPILSEALKGAELAFITCGLGGGTGTGGSPIIAEIAKQAGATVIGLITLPFGFEGESRNKMARAGLRRLSEYVDTAVVIDNSRLSEVHPDRTIGEAFAILDEALATTIQGVVETITLPCLVNLDIMDVKAIMSHGGLATIGIGKAEGKNRAKRSVEDAFNYPLHSFNPAVATSALIQVSGGPDLTLAEASCVAELVRRRMAPSSKLIWGARVSPSLSGVIRTIMLIAGIKDDFF